MRIFPRSTGFVLGLAFCAGLSLAGCSRVEDPEMIRAKWLASPHGDSLAWSFSHWTVYPEDDRDCVPCHSAASTAHSDLMDKGMTFDQLPCNDCHHEEGVPTECAKCHSTGGYLDFLGLDDSVPGQVDRAAPLGTTVGCEACHNDATSGKNSSVMPSGIEITGLGMEASCLDCHQGRHSKRSVDEAVGGLTDDEVDDALRFIDIHSGAAGASQYGTQAKGGYEYDGQTYEGPYTHVILVESCIACHDAHSTAIKGEQCNACHVGARTAEGRVAIRVSGTDFDGDRDVTEGLAEEVAGMRKLLLRVIRIYAGKTKGLERIVYEDKIPYFFDEQGKPYATWTPRLLRAAYNYQYTAASGGFAHHGKYHIQLLFDSTRDLGADTSLITRP